MLHRFYTAPDPCYHLVVKPLQYRFETGVELEMVFVEGTRGQPYLFGEKSICLSVDVPDFVIATFTVTNELWAAVVDPGEELSDTAARFPKVEISWDQITSPGGFLDQINAQAAHHGHTPLRLPTETEWEYAARGGPHWRDGYRFSGSNDIESVAWYQGNSGNRKHEVGLKAPNQLGIYDMCGNAWEWCQDTYRPDVTSIPANGGALVGPAEERVLRGGCFHNWAVHCTVSKRYEIGRQFYDGCIGLRLAMTA